MEKKEKYKNWKIITEADYITLFIKTWFTYIAILRELFPKEKIFDENGKPKGDNPFLKKFNQEVLPIIQHKIRTSEIEKFYISFYSLAMKKTIETFPRYFFKSFYWINEEFKYYQTFSEATTDKTIISFNQKNNKLSLKLQIINNKYKESFSENFNYDIDLKKISSELEKKLTENENEIFNIFNTLLENDLNKYINEKMEQLEMDKRLRKGKKLKKYVYDAFEKFRGSFKEILLKYNCDYSEFEAQKKYILLIQKPYNLFEYKYNMEINKNNKTLENLLRKEGLEWYSYFIYQLRNALFHEIIDPLDKEWQEIYKNVYFILKEIIEICLNLLNKKEELLNRLKNEYIDKNIEIELEKLFFKIIIEIEESGNKTIIEKKYNLITEEYEN